MVRPNVPVVLRCARSIALIAAAAALAGCSGGGGDASSTSALGTGSSSAGKPGTSTSAASVPATSEPASDTSISVYTGDETQQFYHFPDDVPVPDGKVIAVEKITHKQGNPSYVVRIDTTDPAAAMAAYKAKIEAAGFTVTATGADSFSATDDVDDVVATTAMVDGKRELRVTVVPR